MTDDTGEPPGTPAVAVPVEHVVLGVVNWWSTKFSHKQVLAMVEKNFNQEEILDAQKVLAKALGEADPKKRQNSQLRPAVEAQAEDLCDKVDTLIKEDKMPRVLIPCDQLGKVPLATLSISDEQSVCARLESLEARMTKMCDVIARSQANPAQALGNRVGPYLSVTPPGIGDGVAQPHGYAAAVRGQTPQSAGAREDRATGAGHGVNAGHVGGAGASLGVHVRSRSPSVKRKNPEDDSKEKVPKEFPPRKPRKLGNGASKVDLDDIAPGGLAGPVNYYIGNTDKRADGDIIARVLKKCAAPLEGGADLEVLEVELLTAEENPRTKCWKVTVPYKFKDLMEKDDLYLPGWKHRKFFGSRKKGTENQAKKSRVETLNQGEAMIIEREKETELVKLRHEKEQEETLQAQSVKQA